MHAQNENKSQTHRLAKIRVEPYASTEENCSLYLSDSERGLSGGYTCDAGADTKIGASSSLYCPIDSIHDVTIRDLTRDRSVHQGSSVSPIFSIWRACFSISEALIKPLFWTPFIPASIGEIAIASLILQWIHWFCVIYNTDLAQNWRVPILTGMSWMLTFLSADLVKYERYRCYFESAISYLPQDQGLWVLKWSFDEKLNSKTTTDSMTKKPCFEPYMRSSDWHCWDWAYWKGTCFQTLLSFRDRQVENITLVILSLSLCMHASNIQVLIQWHGYLSSPWKLWSKLLKESWTLSSSWLSWRLCSNVCISMTLSIGITLSTGVACALSCKKWIHE